MRVLVACEFSGTVRDAFRALGHDAISCDILPTEAEGPHIQGDVRDVDFSQFDLMIAHPPCTHLATSGALHFKKKIADGRQQEALDFVQFLLDAPVPRICVENPVSVISSKIYLPTQIIQPWQFGDPETKTTCLWLSGLWPLFPTNPVKSNGNRIARIGDKPTRWKERSKTYPGIARAMAEQWGGPLA